MVFTVGCVLVGMTATSAWATPLPGGDEGAAGGATSSDGGSAEAISEKAVSEKAVSEKAVDDEPRFKLKGRVFVRDTIVQEGWENRLAITSARLGANYRDRARGLRGEVDIELSEGKAEIRDAYIGVRAGRKVYVQAGRFKRPISAIAMTSRWDLPVIERGYVNDLALPNERSGEPDVLPLSGRVIGVSARLRDRSLPAKPTLTVGVFRSPVHAQVATSVGFGNREPVGWGQGFPEDLYSRLQVEPIKGVEVGVSFGWLRQLEIAGTRDSFRHGYVSGVDLVIDEPFGDGVPVQAWLEGFVGDSPFHFAPTLEAQGRFMAARAIVAVRLRLAPGLILEPYVTGQILDASGELDEDRITQGGGGINVKIAKSWRIQTAVDHASVDRRFLYDSSTQLLVQLGAVF